jgi:cytosine/adenosine deaminase-related metal-dependent hydrolase
MAKSGAVVGICPTTEANLGDGLFPAVSYLEQHGRFGIGSTAMSPSRPSRNCAGWNTASA